MQLSILLVTLLCVKAYLKISFSKSPPKPMTDPLLYDSMVDKINQFHQNITQNDTTTLSAYHIAMLLP